METMAQKRSIGAENTPPILVVVYAQSGSCVLTSLLDLIKGCDADAHVTVINRTSVFVTIPKFKLRYNFVTVPDEDLFALMDSAKVADVLLLVHSQATDSDDLESDPLLSAVYLHFLPTTVHVISGLHGLPMKKRSEVKTRVQKAIHSKFPDEKVHVVDKEQDALQLLHLIGNCKRKRMTYKSHRPQLLAEKISFDCSEGQDMGNMLVTGFVRGNPLRVNGLVHIPGFGDFQMNQIEVMTDPRPVSQRKDASAAGDLVTRIIKPDIMIQESTERENELDPMEGEQNFPTAEEIAEAAANQVKKVVKKVPKGTSEYQAAWIMDEEEQDDQGNEEDGESGDDDSDEDMEAGEKIEPESDDEEDDGSSGEEGDTDALTVAGNEDDDKYDEKMDEAEDEEMREKYRQARDEEMFPDEVDTPLNIAARVRFARYRGLRSFNFSSWDPKESLPLDYSRIFQFQNFNRTRRRLMNKTDDEEDEDSYADVGSFVRVTIKNATREMVEYFTRHAGKPVVLFGLLKHEQKMSVVNVMLRQHASCTQPIKSKERLIFHIGSRRFATRPIFSAHTNGSKFKYERFLRSDTATVATMYAPITFPPASVIVFKQESDGRHVLVASGSLLSVDPDRLVIKRAVLSGHPFKINKKLAVVRYMFHIKEDVDWFKPVELKTKYGRKGHIRAALGTHGHMKCYFDRQLSSMDTVLMNLYKRVFPKWTIEDRVPDPVVEQTDCEFSE